MSTDQAEATLREEISALRHDPLGFVKFCFEWGSGELALHSGPRAWQSEILTQLGEKLKAGEINGHQAIQIAVASGHGIGKSALVSWLLLWGLSTREDTRGVVTAGTAIQLSSKLWAELGKWYRLSLNRHWFRYEATSISSVDPEHSRTWRVDAVAWSKERPESFSGLHNEGGRLLVVFDEASGIDDQIWEAIEGASTDANTEIIRAVFGNPTRSNGAFHRCFHGQRHRWMTYHIDARTVEGVNQAQLKSWAEDYGGEDSDFFRIRVKGQFPRASELQFIPGDLVGEAMKREAQCLRDDPLVMGVDLARGGNDSSVIAFRRGHDAKSIPWVVIPGADCRDSMRLVGVVCDLVRRYRPDAVFADESGLGGPIVDRLRQLGTNVIGVTFGSKSPDPRCANMRAYIWQQLRDSIQSGLSIPNDPQLEADLTAPQYFHNAKDQLLLESKDDLKARGLASPDRGDALALTLSYVVHIASSDTEDEVHRAMNRCRSDWDPFREAV